MSNTKPKAKNQRRNRRLSASACSAREGMWRVYGVKTPMSFEGSSYVGKYPTISGWFWIKRGLAIRLFVRVQGLDEARWMCRQLNIAPNTRTEAQPGSCDSQPKEP
jgi:hypothetical protein